MLTSVEFRSGAFPPYDGESDEINPGIHGKRLAEYLLSELQRRGERVGELFAEDWGWVVVMDNAEFNLWLGVSNSEEHPDGYRCFIEPHTETVRKHWKKIATRERVEALQCRIAEALAAHPDIRDLKWSSHA